MADTEVTYAVSFAAEVGQTDASWKSAFTAEVGFTCALNKISFGASADATKRAGRESATAVCRICVADHKCLAFLTGATRLPWFSKPGSLGRVGQETVTITEPTG